MVFEFLAALVFGAVLSIDSFTAAVALGFRKHSRSDALSFALLSGASEGGIAAVGFWFGKNLLAAISDYDHWIAFGLVLTVALHMIFGACKNARAKAAPPPGDGETSRFHSRGKVLLVSLVTSVDALGVGLGLGVADKPLLLYTSLIAFFAFASTLLGLQLAKRLSERFGPRCEIAGGVILAIIAFAMLRI